MSPAIRQRATRKSSRTAPLGAGETSSRINTRSQTAARGSQVRNQNAAEPSTSVTETAPRTRRVQANQSNTSNADRPITEEPHIGQAVDEPRQPDVVPQNVENRGQPNNPAPAQQDERDVSVVDLVTPTQSSRRAVTRPVEVDLTCDLDDEVYVLLEDINPARRSANTARVSPVVLGSSPPRRVTIPPSAALKLRRTLTTSQGPESTSQSHAYGSSSPTKQKDIGIHCPICFDTLDQVKNANKQMHSTICGHLFCGPCITKVIENTKQCPTCRLSLDMRKVHPVFI